MVWVLQKYHNNSIFSTKQGGDSVIVLLAEKPTKGGKVMTASDFVDKLQAECLDHPALNHSYLNRFKKESLLPFANTEIEQRLMRFGAMDFLDARCVLWDGLERANNF